MRSLIIDGGIPTPEADAGSGAILDLARGLMRRGHEVFFYPDGARPEGAAPGADAGLTRLAEFTVPARPFSGTAGLLPWLAEAGPTLDAVFLSRPGPAAKYLPLLRPYARMRRLYFGHDIHHVRLRMGQSVGIAQGAALLRGMEALERHIWRNSDLVVYPSEEECARVRADEPTANAVAMAIYSLPIRAIGAAEPQAGRRDGLFVGGAAHLPNRDAVAWFANAILPLVRQALPAFTLFVAGAWPETIRTGLQRDGLVFLGPLSESALAECIDRVRMSVVPLRFGGGVKRKVVASLAHGLPVVSTPVGLQGLAGVETDIALVASDAAAVAASIVRLDADDNLWRRLAESGQAFAAAAYSEPAYDAGIRRMLESVSLA